MEIRFVISILAMAMTIPQSHSLRILGLFPHPGVSHFHFFHPVMLGLAQVGHNVTVVSHFPDPKAPSNYKSLIIGGQETLVNSVDLAVNNFDGNNSWNKNELFPFHGSQFFEQRQSFRYFREFFYIHEWGRKSCEATLNSAAIDKVLGMKEKFDVIIVEQFNSDCMIGVAWKFNAPIIGLSSTVIISYYYDRLGIPLLAASVPTSVSDYTDKMSFQQRVSNWVAGHTFPLLRRSVR